MWLLSEIRAILWSLYVCGVQHLLQVVSVRIVMQSTPLGMKQNNTVMVNRRHMHLLKPIEFYTFFTKCKQ